MDMVVEDCKHFVFAGRSPAGVDNGTDEILNLLSDLDKGDRIQGLIAVDAAPFRGLVVEQFVELLGSKECTDNGGLGHVELVGHDQDFGS